MDSIPIHDKKHYKRLRSTIVASIAIMSIIPLMVISGIARHYFDVSYKEKVLSHLKILVIKHRENVDNFLLERLGAIRVLADSFPEDKLINPDFLKERLSILQGEYGNSLVDLSIINEEGDLVAYAGPLKLRGINYKDSEWFNKAVSREHYLSNVFDGVRNTPHFAVTVRRQADVRPWILKATIGFEALSSLVGNIQVGSTGHAFILNDKGELQTTLHSGVKVFSKEIYLRYLNEPQDVHNEVKVVDEADLEGIFIMTKLKEGEWVLGYHQSSAEAFEALYSARSLILFTLVAGVLCILVLAYFLSRRIVNHVAKADAEKAMMNERLIEAGKLASLGEMAAGIAHEINNPVGIMIQEAGWIQDLIEEYQDGPKKELSIDEFTRSVTRIITQGKRCRDITHKLLSFARKSDQEPKDAQLNDLIEEVAALSNQRAKYNNTAINKYLQSDLPLVKISPSEVQQILLNLINNSLDAITGKNGVIDISTYHENGFVVVTVTDNGPGIPKADQLRIFEPFFTTKPVGRGTGLGLSICYGIIKKLGGNITAHSEEGNGTTFAIYFPEAANDGGTEHENQTIDSPLEV